MIHKLKEKIEQFTVLPDEVWGEIQRQCEIIHLKKKEILVPYAALNKNLHLVASGSLEISLLSRNGDSKTVWFFLDDIFNVAICADSVFLNEPTKYEITALEDSTVIKFGHEATESWIKKYPSISEFARKDVVNDFIMQTEIRNHMVSQTPEEFITYLRKKHPSIFYRIPDKNIARFMGITPEWYSKLKKKMKIR